MKKTIIILCFAALTISGCTSKPPRVVIETSMGNVVAEIFTDRAPISGGNFLKLVDEGAYNRGDAVFYRVVRPDNQSNPVKIEVIQGGFNDRDEFPPIAHETTATTGLTHTDGTLSMARSEPGTASSEFFICIGNLPMLDYGGDRNPDGQGFAAFGRVVEGMDVVRQIQQLTDTNQYLVEPLKMNIRRVK